MTRKGAAIYEFHEKSEFEISSIQLCKDVAKKKLVKICWTEEVKKYDYDYMIYVLIDWCDLLFIYFYMVPYIMEFYAFP